MRLGVIGLVAALFLAVANLHACGKTHEAGLQRSQVQLEEAGYDCVGLVSTDHSPVDDLLLDGKGTGDSFAIPGEVERLLQRSGWGALQDVESVSFLGDGTLCVRRKGAVTKTNAGYVAVADADEQKAARGGGLSGHGRRLFCQPVAAASSTNSLGHQRGPSRRPLQEQTRTFAPELPIPTGAEQIQVSQQQSISHPFDMIGQVGFGCSGALVGPCHYVTAGHCVFEPEIGKLRDRVDFNPGRSGEESLHPLGRFQALVVAPTLKWALFGDRASDVAIVQVEGRPGDDIGYMKLGAVGLPDVVNLNIAGYPGDKDIGEMWYDYCTDVVLPFDSETSARVFHSCEATEGTSGSAMWTYSPEDGSRQVAVINTALSLESQGSEGNLTFGYTPSGPFINGVLLQELEKFIEDMQCAS